MERTLTPEIMDDPRASREDLLTFVRWLDVHNRLLGVNRTLLRHLGRWSARWPKGATIKVLDVGTGGGDVPLALARWGRERGLNVRVTGIDLHPTTAAIARERCAADDRVTIVEGDALKIRDLFGVSSFDYVHASLFLHHLSEIRCLTLLAAMEQVAARGVVWTDLVRSRAMRVLVGLGASVAPSIVRRDAIVSVAAGFTRREALDLAARVDMGFLRYRRSGLLYRFTLAGERPGIMG